MLPPQLDVESPSHAQASCRHPALCLCQTAVHKCPVHECALQPLQVLKTEVAKQHSTTLSADLQSGLTSAQLAEIDRPDKSSPLGNNIQHSREKDIPS